MKWPVLLMGLVCYALPAHALTLAEAMKVLKASKFNDYWDDKDGKARLLGKIQAGDPGRNSRACHLSWELSPRL